MNELTGSACAACQKKTSERRKPYRKPELQIVHLALDETLATGCKLGAGADNSCVLPITIYDAGS